MSNELENNPKVSQLLKIIATNLVAFRKRVGLTQDELADKAGIDRTYIGYLENAKQNVTIAKLQAIAEALGVSVTELLHSDDLNNGQSDIEHINRLFPFIQQFQKLAEKYSINDVFQDNGGKLLQTLLVTGLKNLEGREGNDAVDAKGEEYELKSVNVLLTRSFSTHHHLNHDILNKYRKVDWIFSVYEGINLVSIFRVKPADLEPYFSDWEERLNNGAAHINNPKIPLKHVIQFGKLLFTMGQDGNLKSVNIDS